MDSSNIESRSSQKDVREKTTCEDHQKTSITIHGPHNEERRIGKLGAYRHDRRKETAWKTKTHIFKEHQHMDEEYAAGRGDGKSQRVGVGEAGEEQKSVERHDRPRHKG